jgi:hypothetical protein
MASTTGTKRVLGIKSTIFGFKELKQNLDKLPKATKNGLEKSLIPVATMFQGTAVETLENRTNPKYSTKKLAGSIKTAFDIKNMRASIGPDGSAKNKNGEGYEEWVEYGHYITGGKKMFDSLNPKKSNYSGAKWWPGHHYMGRSWSQNKRKALKEVKVKMNVELKKYAVDARKNVTHLATGKTVGSVR